MSKVFWGIEDSKIILKSTKHVSYKTTFYYSQKQSSEGIKKKKPLKYLQIDCHESVAKLN